MLGNEGECPLCPDVTAFTDGKVFTLCKAAPGRGGGRSGSLSVAVERMVTCPQFPLVSCPACDTLTAMCPPGS